MQSKVISLRAGVLFPLLMLGTVVIAGCNKSDESDAPPAPSAAPTTAPAPGGGKTGGPPKVPDTREGNI